ncbi:hypothetical protein O6H91_01G044400 [Diphasiastrum complanatum]|uniref:Uncharacterized protein n=1 Tax=Diphasiastrum complanatum TaxID=34168 RepID=A0ACC2EQJ8_DIPCM|nr:hypothetical protein O6H91_01G044400 [Diphasiastrum complanatum]
MSLRAASHHDAAEIQRPADVEWHMLDKSKFFVLGAALFSGVSAMLYPIVLLKTRQQVAAVKRSSMSMGVGILQHEGIAGLYRGFTTSVMGTIPARMLYMSALEITKSNVLSVSGKLGFSDPASAALANGVAGLSAAIAAQLVWTPIDVVSQRLMVQGSDGSGKRKYHGGINALGSILRADGVKGLYRGFGMSVLTYAPSNALWWASYCVAQRSLWSSINYKATVGNNYECASPSSGLVVGVQGMSAAFAGGVAALVTTPLDTIKTRLQVFESEVNKQPTISSTLRTLCREGGWKACYKGLGPRWAGMSMSATTMITTYEFLKRMSAKSNE